MAEDDDIRIRVQLEDELSQPARRVEDRTRGMGDAATTASVGFDRLREQQERVRRASEELAAVQRLLATGEIDAAEGAEREARALHELTRAEAEAAAAAEHLRRRTDEEERAQRRATEQTKKATAEHGKLFKMLKAVGGGMLGFVKASGKALAMTEAMMAGGIALIGTLGALMHILAPLAGAFGVTLVGGITAAVQAGGALKMAFSGMGSALKDVMTNMPDWSKVSQDLMYMAPAAQSFAMSMGDLYQKALNPMESQVQQSFFAQVNKGVSNLGGAVKFVQPYLAQTGKELGNTAKQAENLLGATGFQNNLGKVLAGNNRIINEVGHATVPLAAALAKILALAQPLIHFIVGGLTQIVNKFTAWVRSAAGTKGITDFFATAKTMIQQLVGAFSRIGQAFDVLTKAAMPFVKAFIGALGQVIRIFLNFVSSARGASAIGQIFKTLTVLVHALVPTIRDLLTLLGGLLKVVGPILQVLIRALQPIIHALVQALMPVLKALMPIIRTLEPVVLMLARAIGKILIAVSPVIVVVLQLANQVLKPLMPIIMQLIPPLVLLIQNIARLLVAVLPLLTPFIKLTFQILKPFIPIITWIINLVAKFIGWIAKIITPIANWISHMNILTGIFHILGDVIHGVWTAIQWVGSKLQWLYDHTLKPIFDGVKWVLDHLGFGGSNYHGNLTQAQQSAVAKAAQGANPNMTPQQQQAYWHKILTSGNVPNYTNPPQNTISGARNPAGTTTITNPGNKIGTRYAGGPVYERHTYLVGERGPELFKTAQGIFPIAESGPQLMTFEAPGLVLPNNVYESMRRAEDRQTAMAAAMSRRTQERASSTMISNVQGGTTYSLEGDTNHITIVSREKTTEQEIRAIMARIEQERRERFIHWRKESR